MSNEKLVNENNQDEYIDVLENLLIFMCKNYEEIWERLMDLGLTENNHTWTKVSRIQGKADIDIARLAAIDFVQPKEDFEFVRKQIKEKREKQEVK